MGASSGRSLGRMTALASWLAAHQLEPITKARGGRFDSSKHPRGKAGKFAHSAGQLNMLDNREEAGPKPQQMSLLGNWYDPDADDDEKPKKKPKGKFDDIPGQQEMFSKHLPGGHDQARHGRRRGADGRKRIGRTEGANRREAIGRAKAVSERRNRRASGIEGAKGKAAAHREAMIAEYAKSPQMRQMTQAFAQKVRAEAKQAADDAQGILDMAGIRKLPVPPPARREKDALGRTRTVRPGAGGEWDWWDRLNPKEQRRIREKWMQPGVGLGVDEASDMLNAALGKDRSHDEAMAEFVKLTRMVDEGRLLAAGRTKRGARPDLVSQTLAGEPDVDVRVLFGRDGVKHMTELAYDRAQERVREQRQQRVTELRRRRPEVIDRYREAA